MMEINYDNFIKPPILRDGLYRMDSINKGHYVVYLPTWNVENILRGDDNE